MELVIFSWKPGLKTISLIALLRERFGMGLKEAKQAVDGLLNEKEIRLPLPSLDKLGIQSEVESLGGLCRLE